MTTTTSEFNPGDRVKIIGYPDTVVNGMIGTIRKKSIHWYIVTTDDALPQEMWEQDDQPEHDLFVYPSEMEVV